jgi:hypothetical protein
MKVTQAKTNTERLTKALGVLMRKSGELETVTLDELTARFPKIATEEIVDFLKGLPKAKGDFIAGRRGHPSRFVFGDAQEKWNHMEVVRAEWRKRNGLNPATGGPLKPSPRGRKPNTTAPVGRRAKAIVINGVTYQPVTA